MVVSLSSKVPVVSDVALTIAESLLGRRFLGDPRQVIVTHDPLTVDHAVLPPSTAAGLVLTDGELSIRVELDEAWWNDRELANSTVTARLALGAGRSVTLWLSGDDPLHWRMSGLRVSEVEVVTGIVGVAPTN